MNGLVLDLRAGLRSLRRTPGHTILTFGMLAIGIAACTSVYGIIRSVLLQPLPFAEPEQLLHLCETNVRANYCVTAPPNGLDWARRSHTLEAVSIGRSWHYTMKRGATSRGLMAGIVTPELFQVLRIKPQLGRVLQPADQAGEGAPVVMLSDEFWRGEFGADPKIVGSTIDLDGVPHTVVGIAPAGLIVPGIESRPSLWRPLHIDPRDEEHRDWRGFTALARMRPGVTLAAVQAELNGIAAQLATEHPETNREWGVRVRSLQDYVVGNVRPTLWLFAGAVALVLLIVCANTANLILARAVKRQFDLAVRVVNGASRSRLLRQLVLESGLLAFLAAIAGYLLAVWGTHVLLALSPSELPRAAEIKLDRGVFAFALVLGATVTLLVGLAPALWTSQTDVQQLLRAGDARAGRGFGSVRANLVIAEVALSIVLLVAAGLLLRSFDSLLRWEPGFNRANLLMVQVFPPAEKYASGADVIRLYDRAAEALAAIPGVQRVAKASAGPIFGGFESYSYRLPQEAVENPYRVRWYDIDHEFFPTLGMPVLRGRNFTIRDDASSPGVVIVNESFVARHWPNENPIGKRVELIEAKRSVDIVGVVRDVPGFGRETTGPEMYWPQRQQPRWATFFVLRTSVEPTSIAALVRERLAQVEADFSIGTPVTTDSQIGVYTARDRFNLLIVALFSVAALLLAIAGLFGVIAFTTAQRSREFGIRAALGGRPLDIIRLVLRQAAQLVALGSILGVLGALASSKLLQGFVFGVSTRDPFTYIGALVVLGLAGLLAALAPAIRAARHHPLAVLREP